MVGKITIVGLGSGNEDSLSIGVFKLLKNSNRIYLRTKVHPVVDFLNLEGIEFETFDYLYDTLTEYEMVYKRISLFLLDKAIQGETIVYAVPGHPMVAEKSVKFLIEKGNEENVEVEIIGGESFIDTFFSRLNIDPIEGFLFLNAETITREDLNPSKNIIIGQVYNQFIASDLKITLMEIYPDDTLVWLVSNLGIKGKESIKKLLLHELDHNKDNFHYLSSVYIPIVLNEDIDKRSFSKLVDIVKTLRSPDGCPWDKAQTHQTIRKNLIEEAYELVETIDEVDMEHMVEELGDVLLQIMLHSQLGLEEGYFDIYDVIRELNDKLIRRHPHVFGDREADDAEEALAHWQQMKEKEKQGTTAPQSILEGIPKDLPAILKAYQLQKKAASVKFDWTDIKDVYAKIEEELQELKEASQQEIAEELGDLLFAVVNLARFLNVDPEEALAQTNLKFFRRFNFIEEQLNKRGISFEDASFDLLDEYWNEAKKQERLRG